MRHRVALVAWSALALALAAVPLAGAYRSPWTVGLLALAAALPFGLVALGLALGVRRWAVAVAGVALGVAATMVVLDAVEPTAPVPTWRTSPALEALGPLLDAVPRLLTAPRPAPTTPDLLAPTLLFAWLVALAVAVVAVPARTARAAPLVGAAVLYVAGALLSAGRADRHGTVAVAVVLVLAVGWTVLPGRDEPAPGRRRGLAYPVAATTVAASFALVAGALPTTDAFEPRAHVPPPELPAAATNPVPEVAAWNLDPDRTLFTVRPGAQQLPERLALATLADFDGAAWTLDARLRAIGVVDEPLLPDGTRRAGSDLTVVLEQLSGAWLPSAGRTTAADGAEVLMDVDTGTLVLPDGAVPGLTVHLTGGRDAPTAEELARAGVPPATEAGRYLQLPRLPEELRAEAARVTADAHSRLEQALAIEAAVRGGRTHDLAAQSGSSYGRLLEFLFLPADEAGQVGSAEQFSGAFAVLARAVGLPTRLVVGVDLARAAEEAAGAGDALPVRGRHATIWPEVYFAGAGWVPFTPTPEDATVSPPPAAPQQEDEEHPEDVAGDPATARPPRADRPQERADERAAGVSLAVAAAGAGGGVLGLVLLVLLALRLTRRNRWRRAGARGAWAQVLDALVLAGHRPGPGDTAPDVVARLEPAVREDALLLAGRAEAAAFAPPSGSRGPVPGHADDWRSARTVERSLRRTLHWPSRVWWWFTPCVWRR